MANKITVYRKAPGKAPEQIRVKNTVEGLKEAIGGWYEVMRITKESVMLINQQDNAWWIKKGKYNCKFLGRIIYGPMIFMGLEDDDNYRFTDAPISFKEFKRIFPGLWQGDEK